MKHDEINKWPKAGYSPTLNKNQVAFITRQLNMASEAVEQSGNNEDYKHGASEYIDQAIQLILGQWRESERHAEKFTESMTVRFAEDEYLED